MPVSRPDQGPGVICICCCWICRREYHYVDERRLGNIERKYQKSICDGETRRKCPVTIMGIFGPFGMPVSVGYLADLWAQVMFAISAAGLVLGCMSCSGCLWSCSFFAHNGPFFACARHVSCGLFDCRSSAERIQDAMYKKQRCRDAEKKAAEEELASVLSKGFDPNAMLKGNGRKVGEEKSLLHQAIFMKEHTVVFAVLASRDFDVNTPGNTKAFRVLMEQPQNLPGHRRQCLQLIVQHSSFTRECGEANLNREFSKDRVTLLMEAINAGDRMLALAVVAAAGCNPEYHFEYISKKLSADLGCSEKFRKYSKSMDMINGVLSFLQSKIDVFDTAHTQDPEQSSPPDIVVKLPGNVLSASHSCLP